MAKSQESIRLFKNPILEAMTHVHPIIPLVMWGPFTVWLFYRALILKNVGAADMALYAFLGLFVWTITEYVVHRFLFHFPAKSRFGKYLIFLFHGIHHDQPDDPTRLVMPPVPAVILMAMFFGLFSLVIPENFIEAFMAWFVIGYLIYDYIHYATHHFPMKSKVGRYLRKYHLRHHHAKEESKYGVSNPMWDYILGTVTGPKKDIK
ncbi:MAG: sterol desaturase family protein [Bdellovibrionota bacterium]|jgi:sterol desaturase/sphingolipid hydroxylase (fatty acid hydroxylase superfamily)|nr:sterol desaturase family protein [Bdellovibrionota bacterium]